MRTTQMTLLLMLLTRKKGCTTMDAFRAGSTSLHRRLTDLERRGWSITRQQVDGERYKRYFAHRCKP